MFLLKWVVSFVSKCENVAETSQNDRSILLILSLMELKQTQTYTHTQHTYTQKQTRNPPPPVPQEKVTQPADGTPESGVKRTH